MYMYAEIERRGYISVHIREERQVCLACHARLEVESLKLEVEAVSLEKEGGYYFRSIDWEPRPVTGMSRGRSRLMCVAMWRLTTGGAILAQGAWEEVELVNEIDGQLSTESPLPQPASLPCFLPTSMPCLTYLPMPTAPKQKYKFPLMVEMQSFSMPRRRQPPGHSSYDYKDARRAINCHKATRLPMFSSADTEAPAFLTDIPDFFPVFCILRFRLAHADASSLMPRANTDSADRRSHVRGIRLFIRREYNIYRHFSWAAYARGWRGRRQFIIFAYSLHWFIFIVWQHTREFHFVLFSAHILIAYAFGHSLSNFI